MDRLQERLDLLRWLLPLVAFLVVLVHQIIEHYTGVRQLSWRQHFATQLIFYGIMGPVVVWGGLTWISRTVSARKRATDQLAMLHNFSQKLATTPDEDLPQVVVRFPEEILDVAGCSLTIFDDRNRIASLEATWGLSDPHAEALRQRMTREVAYDRCQACKTLRATVTDRCPALPAVLTESDEIESVICLPLGRGGKVTGRLNVFLPTAAQPPDDQLRLLNAMSAEAAPAIEAAQLRTRELGTLYQVDQTIRHRLDLDAILHQILQEAVDACEAEGGAILLHDDPGQPLAAHLTVPDSFRVKEGEALAEVIAERGAPVRINELGVAEDVAGSGSAIGIPMTVEGEVLGVLYVAHADPQRLTERQVRLLSAVASQAGLIVQNARFYEQLEGRAILEERARLAREMHDGLAQGLGYLNMKVQKALLRLEREQVAGAESEMAEVKANVQDLYTEVRSAIDGLRMPFEPDRSFTANLRAYVDRISDRSELRVQLEIPELEVHLTPAVSAQVLRVVQEAANNVVKHAHAQHAEVRVEMSSAGLEVLVEDDGRGFDPGQVLERDHWGLQIMQERTAALGGELDIHSELGRGTTVALRVPQRELEGGYLR